MAFGPNSKLSSLQNKSAAAVKKVAESNSDVALKERPATSMKAEKREVESTETIASFLKASKPRSVVLNFRVSEDMLTRIDKFLEDKTGSVLRGQRSSLLQYALEDFLKKNGY